MKEKIIKSDICYGIMVSIILSFWGFIMENVANIIGRGEIECRYHVFPFLPLYFLIGMLWYYLKDRVNIKLLKNNLLLFLTFGVGSFIYEIVYGNLVEKLFKVVLWDYSGMPLIVTKYTGLITCSVFGVIGVICVRWIFPKLFNYVKKFAKKKILIIDVILGSLILGDFLIYLGNLIIYHRVIMYWVIRL